MEFCRGACLRLFGDYAAYGDVDPKKLPRNRYFVIGFGGAKVFDMNAPHAAGKGDTLGVRLPNGHIIRQLYVYEDQKIYRFIFLTPMEVNTSSVYIV